MKYTGLMKHPPFQRRKVKIYRQILKYLVKDF
jgi:hypothetical protein